MIRQAISLRLSGAVTLAWLVCAGSAGTQAASSESLQRQLLGSINGFVTGPGGAAQMGASVQLLNHFGFLVERVLTNEKGTFAFDNLEEGLYTVRVFQTSFAPVSRGGVLVKSGAERSLAIQLATVMSSIELVNTRRGPGSLITDDWKWVLRGSAATRPILRFLPSTPDSEERRHRERSQTSVFTDTHGLFTLSAGEVGSSRAGSIADMGTAFALSTSVFGANRLMLSGNVGYSSANGMPAAGFRTSYRRTPDAFNLSNPEFRLTVQQVFLPSQTNRGFGGAMSAVSMMSAGMSDQVVFNKYLSAEFGASLDSVTFGSRNSYFSPYALTALSLGRAGVLEFGFSSGIPPVDVYRARRSILPQDGGADLHQNVTALALMPRLTLRDGRMRVQRSENYEISYRKSFGSRTISAGYFREGLSNAALTISSGDGVFPIDDVMPDFNSRSGVFNIGDFSRTGVTIAGAQKFGEVLTIAMIVSRGGVLRTDQYRLTTNDAQEMRDAIRRDTQNAISARASGVFAQTGTSYSMSYQWTDTRALTPGHLFLTNLSSPDAGLNISLRQRVPAPAFMAGRMELSAEMRNLLAQGYLPVTTNDNRRMLLIHTPRSLRGGVAFIF